MDKKNFIEAQREFWNVDSLEQAMFERVLVDDSSAGKTKAELEAWWERSTKSSVELILKDLPVSADWHIFEIGCGVGRLIKPLRERFSKVDGVDVSERMIEFSAEYLPSSLPNGTLSANNGYDFTGFPDNEYQLVFSLTVFQHIRSLSVIKSYLDEALRILKPGGYLRIQVHDKHPNLATWNEEGVEGEQYQFRGNSFSEEEITNVVTEIGFNECSIERTHDNKWLWVTAQKPE